MFLSFFRGAFLAFTFQVFVYMHIFRKLSVFQGACSVLSLAGNASNFVLYCLSGSRFRRALRDTVTEWSRKIAP